MLLRVASLLFCGIALLRSSGGSRIVVFAGLLGLEVFGLVRFWFCGILRLCFPIVSGIVCCLGLAVSC